MDTHLSPRRSQRGPAPQHMGAVSSVGSYGKTSVLLVFINAG